MPNVIVARQTGEQMTISAPVGKSLMIALRDRDGSETVVGEDFGLCGGCCTCYTCHVWVDEAFFSRLSPPSLQESDLLDFAEHRRANSRLSCQIALTDAIDGIRVTLPHEV
jgi:2Fe-2S ferredoxin